MSTLDNLLDAVKNRITQHVQDGKHQGFDTDGLIDKISDLFGRHKQVSQSRDPGNVRPASEDPYGDPADQLAGRRVKPASQDPYGDPADEARKR
jgi:hypothetical protein